MHEKNLAVKNRDEDVDIWKIKKLIKSLKLARGYIYLLLHYYA